MIVCVYKYISTQLQRYTHPDGAGEVLPVAYGLSVHLLILTIAYWPFRGADSRSMLHLSLPSLQESSEQTRLYSVKINFRHGYTNKCGIILHHNLNINIVLRSS